MSIVQDAQEGVKTYGQIIAEQGFGPEPVSNDEEGHMATFSEGLVDSRAVAPHAWSSTFAQARREAIRLQAMEEQFSCIAEADQFMLQLGLEPVPGDHFADAVSQKGEGLFQAIEQRATEENSPLGVLASRWPRGSLLDSPGWQS
jgi:hypothetical protein